MVLSVGSLTALNEINRSMAHDILSLIQNQEVAAPIINKVNKITKSPSLTPLLREEVYSIGKMRTNDEDVIKLFMKQFFTYRPDDTFFFKYLAKENGE